MIKYYASANGFIKQIEDFAKGCWVNVVSPTMEELNYLENTFKIPMEMLKASLDIEEKSRIEIEDDKKLIVVDIPTIDNEMPEYESYNTLPLSIISTKDAVFTICMHDTSILNEISKGKVRNFNISFKTQFILKILFRIATRFLLYLRKIERASINIERQLNQSLKNEELLQLLALSKSLTYFQASLRSNYATLKKLMRGHILKLYEEDVDLLEDAIIEVTQAIDMASSYAEILKAIMDTYTSVSSNNLNVSMKVLAVLTIVMAVPNITFAFYGMNVFALPYVQTPWFALVLSVVLSIVVWIMIKKAKFYK